jgi:hypothetical protein
MLITATPTPGRLRVIQAVPAGEKDAVTPTFRRVAAYAAVLAAAQSLAFTVSFALFVREGYRWAQWASAIALMVSALITLPVLVALYERLRGAEPEFSVIALVIGLTGVLGATVHGAFDVAVLANPVAGETDLPNQVDPRGFLTFGLTGLALALFGWLAVRTGRLPRLLGQTGLVAGLILLVVYIARLTALDPNNNVIRVGALASGLALVPAFYVLVARATFAADT